MLLAGALAVIALERLLSAVMIVSVENNAAVSIRLLIAFVCGGLAPAVFLVGYFGEDRRK
jgi:hypothetical protein